MKGTPGQKCDEMLLELLETVPGFEPRWKAFRERHVEEDHGYLPAYSAMGELAHYLVDRYAEGATSEFPALFGRIEAHCIAGDDDRVNLLQAGLFEDMQGVASHREFGFDVFREWLGPASLKCWDEADAAMRKVAALARASRPRWWQFWRRRRAFRSATAVAKVKDPELKKILEAEYRDFDR